MAKQFVCVRVQSMNGVNLEQFPFERDLTWMAFFQNAKGRTYTRYGGREDHDSESHMNKASLIRVMQQVLALHENEDVQPDNRYEPVPKSVRRPSDLPLMKKMMAKRKESCIHCHDVKAVALDDLRQKGRLDKNLVYTYPSPARLGLDLDPAMQNKVRSVGRGTPAAAAGIRPGDLVRTIDDQRVLTFGDATRVLELAPQTGALAVALQRGNQELNAKVELKDGWRKNPDPSWRPTTGSLGPWSGVWGKRATDQQRRQLGLSGDKLAVRVNYIWAAWARQAGIKNGDTIVAVNGYSKDMTIHQFQAYLHLNSNWGDRAVITVRRGGRNVDLNFQFPQKPPGG